MPNCFTLTPKGSTNAESLAEIDAKMCEHFGAAPDPRFYYMSWMDIEGMALAMGKTWDQMREIFKDDERGPIIDWLEEHYTADAWAEIGRRN